MLRKAKYPRIENQMNLVGLDRRESHIKKGNDYGHIGEVNSPEGFMESLQLRLKLWLVPNLSIHQALRNLPTDNL